MEFKAFPKMPRWSRDISITEKIDGSNASVLIHELPEGEETPAWVALDPYLIAHVGRRLVYAGKRTAWCTPDKDNFGFATWVKDNAGELVKLGPGQHFGEFWGPGIQRRYNIAEKRFSLFNVGRWDGVKQTPPACCHVVPVLYQGPLVEGVVTDVVAKLAHTGSIAAPGFMDPEGVMIFHVASGQTFKKTIKNDEAPKSLKAAA